MTRIRILIAWVAAAGALSACAGGTDTAPTATSTGATSTAASPTGASPTGAYSPVTPDETAIAAVFRDHNEALLSHDFARACSFHDPVLDQQLVAQAAAGDGRIAGCEDALKAIYANPDAVAASDGIARTARITAITVGGDAAEITWSVENRGKQSSTTTGMRRIDGQWRLSGPAAAN